MFQFDQNVGLKNIFGQMFKVIFGKDMLFYNDKVQFFIGFDVDMQFKNYIGGVLMIQVDNVGV